MLIAVHSFSRSHRLLTFQIRLSDLLCNQTKILVVVFPRVLDLTNIYSTYLDSTLYILCCCDIFHCVTQSCLRPVKQACLAAPVWRGAGIHTNKGSRLFLRRGRNTQLFFFHIVIKRDRSHIFSVMLFSHALLLLWKGQFETLLMLQGLFIPEKKDIGASIKSLR